ncbi:MAG: formyltransferase family protein [Desulfuromonadales bacterium]
MKIVVAGATISTLKTVEGLVRNGANVAAIFSLDESVAGKVSGFASPEIREFALHNGIQFYTFININQPATIEAIRNAAPDVLFAVGFSQIVGNEVLAIPKLAAIGFHPTMLPTGRGRAPLAWLTYDASKGAATFFVMGAGVDDGPILAQEPFSIDADDHAFDVAEKLLQAMDRAFDRWIPEFNKGIWNPMPQDEYAASYTGIRQPEDGNINWQDPCAVTYARIRAASQPHPGAYSYLNGEKIIIWRASRADDMPWRGVPGRILLVCPDRGVLVQAGEGRLWLESLENASVGSKPIEVRVGWKFGYCVEDELYRLSQEMKELRDQLK